MKTPKTATDRAATVTDCPSCEGTGDGCYDCEGDGVVQVKTPAPPLPSGTAAAIENLVAAASRLEWQWHPSLEESYPAGLPVFYELVNKLEKWAKAHRTASR